MSYLKKKKEEDDSNKANTVDNNTAQGNIPINSNSNDNYVVPIIPQQQTIQCIMVNKMSNSITLLQLIIYCISSMNKLMILIILIIFSKLLVLMSFLLLESFNDKYDINNINY